MNKYLSISFGQNDKYKPPLYNLRHVDENNLIKYAWLKDINSLLMGIKLTLHYTQLWLVYNHEKLTLGILKSNTLVQN